MGLRQVKKERTRKAIEDAAIALFAERGYQATTVADIAQAADIAPRTFFGYYASKEDVLFGDADQMFDELAEHLRTRPAGQPTFDALLTWMTGISEELGPPDAREQLVRKIVASSPALQARERLLMGRFEGVLAEAVAVDLGEEGTAMRPRMVAAAATAALWCMREADEGGTREHSLDRLNEAIAFLRSGTEALAQAQSIGS